MAEADTQDMAQSAKKYWSDEGYSDGGIIREIDYATQSGGLDPMFAGIKIVDCDTHITEAPDLFTSRAPAALKDKMPYVRRVDGADKWYRRESRFRLDGRQCHPQGQQQAARPPRFPQATTRPTPAATT